MHLHVLPSSFTLCLVGPAGKRESVSVMTGYLPHNDLFLGHCEANKSFEAQLSFPAFGDGLVKITEKPVFKEEQRRMWAGKHGARNRSRNASHGDGHTLRLYLRFDCLLSTCPCERGSGQLQCARNRIAQWLESKSLRWNNATPVSMSTSVPQPWFLSAILHQEKSGILGEMRVLQEMARTGNHKMSMSYSIECAKNSRTRPHQGYRSQHEQVPSGHM